MTCIAAVSDGENVWMGGDSLASNGWDSVTRRDPKVFRKGEFLFGFTSSFRMGQLLMYSLPALQPPADGDLHAYMARSFIDIVRDCLKAGGYAERDKERESGGTFLVGVRGRLFEIESDYQVGEAVEPYAAVGCGLAYAKGSLFTTPNLDPADRIRLALEAAERHSTGVRGPFTILTTKATA